MGRTPIRNPDDWCRGPEVAAWLRKLADQEERTPGWVRGKISFTYATDREMREAKARQKVGKTKEGGRG